jgi:hypothetical protein
MKPNRAFVGLNKEFWANIRTISQKVGYTEKRRAPRGSGPTVGAIKVPTLAEIATAYEALNLDASHLVSPKNQLTRLGKKLIQYFEYRANLLNQIVEPLLMTAEEAASLFADLRAKLNIASTVPMNKQSDDKKRPAYLTGIVNMLIEANLSGLPCNYNPQALTTVTHNRQPFRTLARRVDGAFPGPVDPIAVWEIKEYYYTTTFGSRVADGVYESLLDGMELEELDAALRSPAARKRGEPHIQHLLMVDAHFTWWIKGRSQGQRAICGLWET